jgi:hypothetical protein
MSSRLRFTNNRPANTDNHYVVGSGIGSKSRFVRSALRRRSSNNAQGKPCCSSKNKIHENKSCLNGMVWKECGSACTPTCDNTTPICTEQCVERCECPQGHVLHGGKCVDVNTCEISEPPTLGGSEPPTLGESSDVSCGALGGNYIKDSDGNKTRYCCTSIDSSGCTSGSTDDVCLDTTSNNGGNDVCLGGRFSKTTCSKSPIQPNQSCSIPEKDTIRIRKLSLSDCPAADKYYTTVSGVWTNTTIGPAPNGSMSRVARLTYEKMALGWKDAGMNVQYCKDALIIVAGECPSDASGCRLVIKDKDGKDSIVGNPYTLDSANVGQAFWDPLKNAKAPEGLDLNNPCTATLIAHDLFMTQPEYTEADINSGLADYDGGEMFGPNPSCYAQTGAVANPKRSWTKAYATNAPLYKDTSNFEVYDKSTSCNWVGPFCQLSNKSFNIPSSLGIWNGGSDPSKGAPYKCYYGWSFLNRTNKLELLNNTTVTENCKSYDTKINNGGSACTHEDCVIIDQISSNAAQEICDTAYLNE